MVSSGQIDMCKSCKKNMVVLPTANARTTDKMLRVSLM